MSHSLRENIVLQEQGVFGHGGVFHWKILLICQQMEDCTLIYKSSWQNHRRYPLKQEDTPFQRLIGSSKNQSLLKWYSSRQIHLASTLDPRYHSAMYSSDFGQFM